MLEEKGMFMPRDHDQFTPCCVCCLLAKVTMAVRYLFGVQY